MAIEVLTKDDLLHFKQDLLSELRQILKSPAVEPQKKWIKSEEVKKLSQCLPRIHCESHCLGLHEADSENLSSFTGGENEIDILAFR